MHDIHHHSQDEHMATQQMADLLIYTANSKTAICISIIYKQVP